LSLFLEFYQKRFFAVFAGGSEQELFVRGEDLVQHVQVSAFVHTDVVDIAWRDDIPDKHNRHLSNLSILQKPCFSLLLHALGNILLPLNSFGIKSPYNLRQSNVNLCPTDKTKIIAQWAFPIISHGLHDARLTVGVATSVGDGHEEHF